MVEKIARNILRRKKTMRIISLKIVYLGDPAVGKTTLRRRFMGERFNEKYDATIGVDMSTYNMSIYDYRIKFLLFDLAGQLYYYQVRQEVYKGSHGAFIVFDLTNYRSFYNIANWIREYWRNTSRNNPFILIGNKKDLVERRQVTEEQVKQYIDLFYEKTGYKIDYIETSAKTGENVKKAFNHLVIKIAKFLKQKNKNA